MKMIYFANVRMPTDRAHGAQIIKNCEAFANHGVDLTLVVPWRYTDIRKSPYEYYKVEQNFKIKKIFSIDLVRFGKLGFIIQTLSFALSAFIYGLFNKSDIYYGRDHFALFLLSFFRSNMIWEPHDGKWNMVVRTVAKTVKLIVAITDGVKRHLVKRGIDQNKIIVAPDGVDLTQFSISISKEDARRRLGLPQDKKIVLYMGALEDWKGYKVLLGALPLLHSEVHTVLSGGDKRQVEDLRLKHKEDSVTFLGTTPYADLPINMQAADILIAPNTVRDDISRLFTSPLKIFAYMTSGIPMIVSDLPSMREVLNDQNALLVEAESPEAIAEGVKKLLSDRGLSESIARQAREDAESYTWRKRVDNILTSYEGINRD